MNEGLGERISLAPASPILSLSSTTSSNLSQSSKSHLVQSAGTNLPPLPSPIACSELSGDEEIDIIGPPSPFRSRPIAPEQCETDQMYAYLTCYKLTNNQCLNKTYYVIICALYLSFRQNLSKDYSDQPLGDVLSDFSDTSNTSYIAALVQNEACYAERNKPLLQFCLLAQEMDKGAESRSSTSDGKFTSVIQCGILDKIFYCITILQHNEINTPFR